MTTNQSYNHHYVPESILRNFAYKKNTVYSLIKIDPLCVVPNNVDNLCQKKGFYEISLGKNDDPKLIERINYDIDVFENLDYDIAPITKKIIETKELKSINSEERDKLIKYTVYQYLRVKSVRDIAKRFWHDEELIELSHARILTDYDSINSLVNILNNYQLDIINPIIGDEFVISDSPVLWDATGEGIYFPISPNICLYYHDRKYDLNNCLDSICINDLQFRASVKHTIARSESVLHKIKNNEYKDHIVKFFKSGRPSYWKCILETNSSDKCISQFINKMDDFKKLI
ncbi:DUF4238 domain-containing protein [Anabaena sp. FACHB-1237]|uniref:DUF4238 domain-containing protein n=1 Tax=Anabaena sp. FACHB-1237 TaxID=2692769 RepID=UPI0016817E8C|nr:DUF4238 domain-containing protein [Anabaena sp. FACHB-1237]MBD2139458.1 DUF4238 domain-containing protein [Anabaena sp. FACHB-1237]